MVFKGAVSDLFMALHVVPDGKCAENIYQYFRYVSLYKKADRVARL